MSDRFHEAFREEASELLSELESALLELEENPEDRELVDRVFRSMHTIKGSGAMFGFEEVSRFTHEVETVFDLVRKGRLAVSKELINLTLKARDHIRSLLEPSAEGHVDVAQQEALLSAFRRAQGKEPAAAVEKKEAVPGAPSGRVTYRIRFQPSRDIFLHGTDPVLLLTELGGLGDCRLVAHTDRIPPLRDLNPEMCHLYWDILLTTDRGMNALKDVFLFVEDDSEIRMDVLDQGGGLSTDADQNRLGEILIERGEVSTADLQRVMGEKKKLGEILVDAGLVSREGVRSALAEQEHVKEVREKQRQEESAASIRVRADKLDGLVDLVGELVTIQARLSQAAAGRSDPEIMLVAEQVERLTGSLRDNAMSLRMLPIGTTFSKFKRVMRDLSADLGKEVELTTEGGETELDKTVIERLNDPLVHLIRNSVDHGIEMPAVREAAGKPRKGTLHIDASHSGANVLIRISDDGAGFDVEAIRAKAVEKGLIAPETPLTEKGTLDLVFLPGFSTARKVTSVSGRGVGMDVVKRSIESLGGSVECASGQGRGTAITLKIPLTLVIIEGLLVRIHDALYVVPLASVEECVELQRTETEKSENARGKKMAHVRGDIVPYIRMREWFGVKGEPPAIEQIVIVRTGGKRVGIAVDTVVGQHQTVIKSLGRLYRNAEGISGATILGDGTVALILDIFQLIRAAEREESAGSA
jgi:two-component system, chemotaxis family, sensor kinase CheA